MCRKVKNATQHKLDLTGKSKAGLHRAWVGSRNWHGCCLKFFWPKTGQMEGKIGPKLVRKFANFFSSCVRL